MQVMLIAALSYSVFIIFVPPLSVVVVADKVSQNPATLCIPAAKMRWIEVMAQDQRGNSSLREGGVLKEKCNSFL